jgi:CheY-like chemotaxis protein
MNYLALYKKIRKIDDDKDRHSVIIAMSASNDNKKECLIAGADNFLPKPLSKKNTKVVLNMWLPNFLRNRNNKTSKGSKNVNIN